MSRILSRRMGAAALSAAAVLSIAAAPAASADMSPMACGWDPKPATGLAYYNHCTNDGSVVKIRVERHGRPGYDACAIPGPNYLGRLSVIRYAWYKGELC